MPPVVDANVFMRGRKRPFDSAYTVPEVMKELKSDEARFNFDLEEISVLEPEEEYVKQVGRKSDDINSPTSDTDEELLALALQLDEKLITDDKALQNLALHLDVGFDSFIQDRIKEKRRWKKRCSNCGAEFEEGKCSVCGSTDFSLKPG